jgi:hypothetical protein
MVFLTEKKRNSYLGMSETLHNLQLADMEYAPECARWNPTIKEILYRLINGKKYLSFSAKDWDVVDFGYDYYDGHQTWITICGVTYATLF